MLTLSWLYCFLNELMNIFKHVFISNTINILSITIINKSSFLFLKWVLRPTRLRTVYIIFQLLEYKLFTQQIFKYFAMHWDSIHPQIVYNTRDTSTITIKLSLSRTASQSLGSRVRPGKCGSVAGRATPASGPSRQGLGTAGRSARRKAGAQASEKARGAAGRQRGGVLSASGRGGGTALTCWSFLPPRPASLRSGSPSLSSSAPGAAPTGSSSLAAAAGSGCAGGPWTRRRGGQGAGRPQPPPPVRTQQTAWTGHAGARAARGRGEVGVGAGPGTLETPPQAPGPASSRTSASPGSAVPRPSACAFCEDSPDSEPEVPSESRLEAAGSGLASAPPLVCRGLPPQTEGAARFSFRGTTLIGLCWWTAFAGRGA